MRELDELKAEVELLTIENADLKRSNADYAHGMKHLQTREAKWREFVELLYVDGHGFEIPNTEKHDRMRKLRSELVEKREGEDG